MKSKFTIALLTLVSAVAINGSAQAANFLVKLKCTNLTDNGVGATAVNFSGNGPGVDAVLSCILNEADSEVVSAPSLPGTVEIDMITTRNITLAQTQVCDIDNAFLLGIPRKWSDDCNVRGPSSVPHTGARVTVTQIP